MWSSSAMRVTVSASTPSSASSRRATSRMSRWRAVSSSVATLEAIRVAQAVADRAIERHMRRPAEAEHEHFDADDARGGDCDHEGRAPEAVHGVVDRDGAGVELTLGQAAPHAEEHG